VRGTEGLPGIARPILRLRSPRRRRQVGQGSVVRNRSSDRGAGRPCGGRNGVGAGGLTTKGCVLYLVYRLYKRLYDRMGPSTGFWATASDRSAADLACGDLWLFYPGYRVGLRRGSLGCAGRLQEVAGCGFRDSRLRLMDSSFAPTWLTTGARDRVKSLTERKEGSFRGHARRPSADRKHA